MAVCGKANSYSLTPSSLTDLIRFEGDCSNAEAINSIPTEFHLGVGDDTTVEILLHNGKKYISVGNVNESLKFSKNIIDLVNYLYLWKFHLHNPYIHLNWRKHKKIPSIGRKLTTDEQDTFWRNRNYPCQRPDRITTETVIIWSIPASLNCSRIFRDVRLLGIHFEVRYSFYLFHSRASL